MLNAKILIPIPSTFSVLTVGCSGIKNINNNGLY